MTDIQALKKRIDSRDYSVGIIGLGYVGLPLVLRFNEVGFRVFGFDTDPAKVTRLNNGESYIQHIPQAKISAMRQSGRFEATADFTRLSEADALLICVPTPLTRYLDPDLSYVVNTADAIAKVVRPGHLVCLESTTYPGTTDEELLPRFSAKGLKVGEDFFLAFSPEREDPGNKQFTTATIPKVVGGTTPHCLELAQLLYSQIIERVIPVSSTRAAESVKLLENIYRSVNIALANELKIVFSRMGIDVWEVIEAAKTKPFGFQPFYPGPGLGGHCIPIDPFYLTWKAKAYGISTRFIELSGEVNRAMPAYVVQTLSDALNRQSKPLQGSQVLVLGLSYKKDIDDLRESPALEVIELLLEKGARVDYSDPYFPIIPAMRHHTLDLRSVVLTEASVAGYDSVLIVTDHSIFPYELLYKSAKLILDSRGAMRQRGFVSPHIIAA